MQTALDRVTRVKQMVLAGRADSDGVGQKSSSSATGSGLVHMLGSAETDAG